MNLYAVIMAGGSGTRFWPASRQKRPKQLLSLTGQRSLLQQTVDRLAPLVPPERVLVVTGRAHAEQVGEQLPELPPANILAEPMGRNTAAACGLAAAWVARRDPGAVCLVLPADHLITDESLFISTLERAAHLAAAQEVLVTLGLTPRFPATGFGYIETGEVADPAPPAVSRVAAFHEKPDLATAQAYLDGGKHLWNSGMFAWRAERLLAELERHLPELASGLAELAPALGAPDQEAALERIYPGLPSISVDHGVLEKCSHLLVVKADFGWSDVGSWEAMGELWELDSHRNANQNGRDKLHPVDSQGNLVSAGDRLVALLGVENLVAVVTDDVLLIAPRSRCQEVGRLLEELKVKGREEYL
ncbi:MAG: NTP transferase domain-containing protein [Desulfarculus sp.]|nr:NTP transferase domain-containing protein [Pseudomonadota bacterium]MBV1717159.1 NTP transferase domain-containing protein [Desulfarculus sp.]MBU4573573.1 NTP transferase domain-containing protein [Pseudomonadota bacterium]MBU4598385.1 NTP transferase domain-containing protein [Pseudomonadota bacterium]MBV1739505.1 NTP transferase domain-containing protein [Desulfarculus sp.]